MTTTNTARMTADQFWDWCQLPENENRRYELNRGRVVEVPSPDCLHGVICGWVAHLLWSYVLTRGQGRVATNDTGILVSRNPDTLRGPDIMLFAEALPIERLNPRYSDEVPRLVVEVRSPSDNFSRMLERVTQYLGHGVPLVWLVDPLEQAITVFRGQEFHRVLDETDLLTGNGILPELSIPVAQIFQLPGTSDGGAASNG
jgi:Uma2 family endonuclease